MLFCEEDDLRLMALVKEHPILYDKSHPNFRDYDAKIAVWQEFSDELQRSVKDCKLRWLHIRDAYRRLTKLRLKSGRGKPYKYEKAMSFLRPFLENFIENEINDNDDNVIEEYVIQYNSDYESKNQSTETPKKKRKVETRKREKREFVDVQEFSRLNNLIEYDKIDTLDAFLLSIGATLRTFSPYHLNIAKTKIFSIVQEHDLEQIVQQQEEEVLTD